MKSKRRRTFEIDNRTSIKCKRCGGKSKVISTLHNVSSNSTRRKRLCLDCRKNFFSNEHHE